MLQISNSSHDLLKNTQIVCNDPVSECILLHTKWVISLNATGGDYNPTAKHYKDTLAITLKGLTNDIDDTDINNYNIYSILKIPLFATFTNQNNTRIDKIFFPQQVSIEKFFKRFIGDYIKISETYSTQIQTNIREKQLFPNNVEVNEYDFFMHKRLTLYTILLNEDLRQFYNKYIIYEKLKSNNEFKLYVIPIPKPQCDTTSSNCNNQSKISSVAAEPNTIIVSTGFNEISEEIRNKIKEDAYNPTTEEVVFEPNKLIDAKFGDDVNVEDLRNVNASPDRVAYYENFEHYNKLLEYNEKKQILEPFAPTVFRYNWSSVTDTDKDNNIIVHKLETPDNFHSNTLTKDRTVRTTFKVPLKVVFTKVTEQFYDDDANRSLTSPISNKFIQKRVTSEEPRPYRSTIHEKTFISLSKGGQRTRKLYNARSSSSIQLNNNIQFQSKRNTKRNQTPKPKNSKIKNKKIKNKK
jgi:hypothetical protein